jgi:hypothetical protein
MGAATRVGVGTGVGAGDGVASGALGATALALGPPDGRALVTAAPEAAGCARRLPTRVPAMTTITAATPTIAQRRGQLLPAGPLELLNVVSLRPSLEGLAQDSG